MNKVKKLIFIILLFISFNPVSGKSRPSLAISMARFDVLNKSLNSLEWRVELRSYRPNKYYNPFGGLMMNNDGALYFYAGVFYDFNVFSNVVITPSFAPGFYSRGKSKDLSFAIEFRSQIEISIKFNNNTRIGISFNHISNGSLGDSNPGVESFALTYILPLNSVLNSI